MVRHLSATPRRTILVVDDEPSIRDLITDILEAEAYQVLTAPDGKAGLAMIHRQRPDLVLTDQMMPYITGTELCRLLKADPTTAAIPVAVMSAAPLRDTTSCALVLAKPFTIPQLLDTIETLLALP